MREKCKPDGEELKRDLAIIILSVFTAIFLVKSGLIDQFVELTKDAYLIGSFVAGIFFTSAFTLPISTVTLIELANGSGEVFLVALVGAAGAVIGDLLLFLFIRDNLTKNIKMLLCVSGFRRWRALFDLKFFRWLTPLLGALIIASPLPDEVGLAMMGFSKLKTGLLIPISYVMNFLGIFAVASLINL